MKHIGHTIPLSFFRLKQIILDYYVRSERDDSEMSKKSRIS